MSNTQLRGLSPGRRMPGGTSAFIVWIVWVAMTAVALATLYRYGRNIPLAEDWQLVMPFTGHQPDVLGWLWSQNNEHRVPVPRLMMLALLWMSGGDFRSGMLFDILSLSLLAAAMMHTARVIRGSSSVSDAFFPLALLHNGHWENLFWTWQLSFVVSIELAAVVLLVLVRRPALETAPAFWTVCTALVLLPLCGATGLIFVPAFGAWSLWCVWNARHAVSPGAIRLRIAGLALAGAIALAYFVGYQTPPWNPPNPGLVPSLRTSLQFLALGWGPAVIGYWKISVGASVLLLGATGVWLLQALWRSRRASPSDLAAFTVFMGNALVFTLLMGFGRAAQIQIDERWPLRYVLLSALTLCGVYFAWLRCGTSRTRRAVPLALALVVTVLVVPNARNGWRFFGEWYDAGMSSLEADIAAGMPVETLAARHQPFLVHWLEPARVAEQIEMLKARGASAFAAGNPHRSSAR